MADEEQLVALFAGLVSSLRSSAKLPEPAERFPLLALRGSVRMRGSVADKGRAIVPMPACASEYHQPNVTTAAASRAKVGKETVALPPLTTTPQPASAPPLSGRPETVS